MLAVRRIREGEGARLRELRLRALKEAPYAFATSFQKAAARSAQHWDDFARNSSAGEAQVTFVAAEHDRWLAMASAFVSSDEPCIGHLVQVWVDPSCRRLGLGRQLVEAVADWTRERGLTQLKTSVTEGNERAEALYEAAGFLLTCERRPLASDSSLTEVVLTRYL